ncbi:hypothetical protein P3342_009098 [Pyrenophora teres f. teres]|nr:hypothetical protein P3342_009098 [Pyrenophora teres f. teres]
MPINPNPPRYLPTMAMVAAGFGVTNALNEANRKVHAPLQPTQEQRNQMLMDSYGERSSLEDMERRWRVWRKSSQTKRTGRPCWRRRTAAAQASRTSRGPWSSTRSSD